MRSLVLAGAMVVVAIVFYLVKRRQPEEAPLDLAYDAAAWGMVLEMGEEVEAQAPVFEPPSWWNIFLVDPTRRPPPTPRQVALTSRGALLVARRARERLSDRARYPLSAVRVEKIEDEGQYCVSLKLRLAGKRRNLYRVPRPFNERLKTALSRFGAAGGT